MEAHFLAAVINSHIGKMQIGPITQGVAQKKISLGRFLSLAAPLPPLQEQIAAVTLLAVAMQKALAQDDAIVVSLKQSAAQRQNILKAAFSGQLVPQDPNDEPASVLLERIRAERAERDKQPKTRKIKANKEMTTVVSKLINVLAEAGDWVPAQEAFRRCGVADGAQTDQIEVLYAELRELDKSKRLAVEPVTDAQGRKLYDRLKLVATA
jgi:type I restriction enzyme S subunit